MALGAKIPCVGCHRAWPLPGAVRAGPHRKRRGVTSEEAGRDIGRGEQSTTCCVYFGNVSDYQNNREQRERRRRTVVRAVGIIIAAAMLLSVVIPAIYAGL